MSDLYDLSDEDLEAAFKAAKEESVGDTETVDTVDDVQETEDYDETDSTESVDDTEEVDEVADESDDLEEDDAEGDSEDESEEVDEASTADTEDKEVPEEPTVHKFKANGKEYEITDEEMRTQFPKVFGQAMDYTKKLQAMKPWRKTIDAMEQAKLSHSDVNLMIDVLKGDKEAIAVVLKRTGVDTLDIDTEKDPNYVAKDYGRDESVLALQDTIDSISADPEYSVTKRIIDSEWDDASWNQLKASPEKIKQLHIDVKSGLYAKLAPLAEKQKLFDGGSKSDIDYYISAAREYFARQGRLEGQRLANENQQAATNQVVQQQKRIDKVKTEQRKRSADRVSAEQRKAAAPSVGSRAKPRTVDYLVASDEDFEEWYKNLEER